MGHFCSRGGGKKGHFSTFRVGQGGRWLGGGVLGARGGRLPQTPPSVRTPLLKISVTTEPIGFYSLGYIPIGPVVVLSYFLGGWDTPNPQRNVNSPPPKKIFPGESTSK